MIDLHSHLLPGIDDGAVDLADAIALAKVAVDSGTTHLVCTPHMHPGRYENTAEGISLECAAFRGALVAAGVALQVAAAAEVRFDMEIMAWHAAGKLPFVGEWEGRKVLLLEFPHGDIPFAAERLTGWLLQNDVVPLIAHPERNKGVMRQPSRLKSFIDQGCLLQVTAGSLAGNFGGRAQELAREMLEANVVTVLASDAHNLRHRPPVLHDGYIQAASIIGSVGADMLVRETPWRIAQGLFERDWSDGR